MTLEEKAKESAEQNGYGLGCSIPQTECYVKGYIAGTKENGIVWHDLFHPQNVFSDEYITPTFVEYVRKLEQQIEKMKCCDNCKHYRWSNGDDWCDDHYGQPMYDEECKGKWELKE